MATLIAETKWHGNPRPTLAYASVVFEELVASPYYLDGRNVPTYNSYVTPVPLEDLAPVATTQVAGPATTVSFKLDGLWRDPTILTILITATGGTDYSAVLAAPSAFLGPVEFAAYVAQQISTNATMSASADGQTVSVFVAAPSTALTITTLTVA